MSICPPNKNHMLPSHAIVSKTADPKRETVSVFVGVCFIAWLIKQYDI